MHIVAIRRRDGLLTLNCCCTKQPFGQYKRTFVADCCPCGLQGPAQGPQDECSCPRPRRILQRLQDAHSSTRIRFSLGQGQLAVFISLPLLESNGRLEDSLKGPNGIQVALGEQFERANEVQVAPKLAPTAPKLAPSASKLAPSASKLARTMRIELSCRRELDSESCKGTTNRSKLTPSASKLAPSASKLAPSAPKLAPSAPRLASSTPRLAPSTPR